MGTFTKGWVQEPGLVRTVRGSERERYTHIDTHAKKKKNTDRGSHCFFCLPQQRTGQQIPRGKCETMALIVTDLYRMLAVESAV